MRSETLAAWQTGMEKTFRTIKRIFSGNRPAWMLSYSFLCGLILTLIIAGIDTKRFMCGKNSETCTE